MRPAVEAWLREQFDRMIKPLGKVVGNDSGDAPDSGNKKEAKPDVEPPVKSEAEGSDKRTGLDEVVESIEPEPKVGKPEAVEPDTGESAEQPE